MSGRCVPALLFLALAAVYLVASHVRSRFLICGYENVDRTWHAYDAPYKGVEFEGVLRQYTQFQTLHDKSGVELMRTTRQRWYDLLAWPDYFFGKRWRLAYRDPSPSHVLRTQALRERDPGGE